MEHNHFMKFSIWKLGIGIILILICCTIFSFDNLSSKDIPVDSNTQYVNMDSQKLARQNLTQEVNLLKDTIGNIDKKELVQ